MIKDQRTEQEVFWTGEFGDQYISRNFGPEPLAWNLALFAEILKPLRVIGSVLEFGANVGMNLRALRLLLPKAKLAGIEINAAAVAQLRDWDGLEEIFHESILEFNPPRQWDFVFAKTVLIHLTPERITEVYDKLYASSARYICVAEYFSRTPVEVEYRGHSGKLFKRDFAGELQDRYPDLALVNYGFASIRNANFPQDDLTWHLLEKKAK